jgi:serine/threonine protein phosphatase PrpC
VRLDAAGSTHIGRRRLRNEDTGAAVARLIARANERGGPDNVTVVLFRAAEWGA